MIAASRFHEDPNQSCTNLLRGIVLLTLIIIENFQLVFHEVIENAQADIVEYRSQFADVVRDTSADNWMRNKGCSCDTITQQPYFTISLSFCHRCCTVIKATGPSGKFGRLPPGFGRATPFSLYIKENFASRKKEQPTEVFSNLTKEWRNLDEAEKRKYVDKAIQINEERRSMFESMSDAEKEELHRRARNLKEARLKRKIRLEKKKQQEDNGQRLLSGWMLFVKEKAVKGTTNPSRKQQDVIRELAVLWKSLPKSDKDAYTERAKILSKSGGIYD
uniref:HMG box domain-containing protein n=1 Tax=Setaria digitata TaxID=48799 RepID=A0A915PLT3_9BILA